MSLSMTVPIVSFHMAALMSESLNVPTVSSLSMTVPTVSFHMAALMSVFECAYCLMSLSFDCAYCLISYGSSHVCL